MGDAASYVVGLIDKVSGPAKDAENALSKLEKQFKKTGRIGVKFTGEGPTPDVVSRLNKAALGTFAKGKIVKPAIHGLDNMISGLTDRMISFGKYAALGLGAAGVAAGAFAIKSTVHMAMFSESTRKAFTLLTGSEAIGEKTFQRTIELSKMLGMDLETTAHAMQKFLAQQFTPPDAEKWLKLGSDLRAVGVEASALDRVFLDLAHVKATGKLNQHNLNMFANAGVSAQLILEEAAKIKGTDMEGIHKLMSSGKLTSDIALPAIERAIMRKTHEHAAGEAGAGFANNTLSGLIGQLKNAPNLFFQRMGEAAKASIMKLKPLVDAIMKSIESIQGDQFVRFIGTALDIATKMVPLAQEFAAGFGEGFTAINDALGKIDPSVASMQTARDLGHAVAHGFELALDALKAIIKAMNWLDAHRNVAIFAASTLLGLKLLGGLVSTINGVRTVMALIGAVTGAAGSGAAGAAATTAAVGAASGGGVMASLGAAATATGAAASTAAASVAAWAGTAVAAASVGAIAAAILPGLLILGWGIMQREENAKAMLGARSDQAGHRGITADDLAERNGATPTPALSAMQKAGGARATTNNVTLQTTVNIEGEGKDGAQLGKDIAEHHRDSMEQFLQTHAIEQGAMAL